MIVRRARQWVTPPAISRGTSENIDRIGVLSEHPDAEGVLLWRLGRDVELWAAAYPAERAHLFAPAARGKRALRLRSSTLPTDVRAHLRRLGRLLATPGDASSQEMSTACAAWRSAYALIRATPKEYPRIHRKLVKLASERVDLGRVPAGAE